MLRRFLLIIFLSFILFFTKVDSANAQACAAPATPTGVTVEYPGCNGSSCDLVQASCAWNSQADAASYNVTVTQVETGTIVMNNESQTSDTTKVIFPITQGNTYKCDVVAVSACGGLSAAASDQLLCEADAILDTPTPTVPPTATPIPPTATPTIEPPGSVLQTASIIGGILIIIVGGILLFVF